jgi:hypothetical protein
MSIFGVAEQHAVALIRSNALASVLSLLEFLRRKLTNSAPSNGSWVVSKAMCSVANVRQIREQIKAKIRLIASDFIEMKAKVNRNGKK